MSIYQRDDIDEHCGWCGAVDHCERACVAHYQVGQRVQLHAATDAWMSGDRYGEIVKIGRTRVHVKCDTSGRTRKLAARDIGEIVS